jgi:hypothetical protein
VIRSVHYHFENVDEKFAKEHGWAKGQFDAEIGEHPLLLYYSGVREIIKFFSDLGTISLNNWTSHGMGSARGIGFENEVVVTIEFASPKSRTRNS